MPTAYTFEASLIPDSCGPVLEDAFLRDSPVISRTLRLGGVRTLHDLHLLIFKAFDRFDPHLYEFQIGGTHPMHRVAQGYQPRIPGEDFEPMPDGLPQLKDAGVTRVDSLGLKVRNRFFYWFDFGDDWWHKVKVVRIEEVPARDAKPVILARVGESPPQYPDFEEDEK